MKTSEIDNFMAPGGHTNLSLYSFLFLGKSPVFFCATLGTARPDVVETTFRSNLLLVNETSSTVVMVDLTCPWDLSVASSHDFKLEKYSPLVADLFHHFKVQKLRPPPKKKTKQNKTKQNCTQRYVCSIITSKRMEAQGPGWSGLVRF